MNHKRQPLERESHILIHLTRKMVFLLALFGMTVAFLGYLTWGSREAAAASSKSITTSPPRMRRFYLTSSGYQGDGAPTACPGGYHFASLWEIADPTNLEYDNTLGVNMGDGGSGPPTYPGWIRTGADSDGSGPPGSANCLGWISDSGANLGTIAELTPIWTITYLHVWISDTRACDSNQLVWCVED
jgi:hypothetical protein